MNDTFKVGKVLGLAAVNIFFYNIIFAHSELLILKFDITLKFLIVILIALK